MKNNNFLEILSSYTKLAKREHLLPVLVSTNYKKLVEEEINQIGLGGPLFRSVYPTARRMCLATVHDVSDYVNDKGNMVDGSEHVYIQKYRNRLLFLTTEKCFSHCQYCFRTDLLSSEKETDLPNLKSKIDKVVTVLNSDPMIEEVILSGGDPLVVGIDNLSIIFERLVKARSDISIRIHTRSIVYKPDIFTTELIKLFVRYNVRLFFHINHPYEISDESEIKIKQLSSAGLRLYNQCPVIRGINDHSKVIEILLKKLDELRIRQISFFIADPICYSADFRVPLQNLFDIFNQINWYTSSWVNSVRLVLDTPIGKVRRENIISIDENSKKVIFQREEKKITYYDFPKEKYKQGDLHKMLWKKSHIDITG